MGTEYHTIKGEWRIDGVPEDCIIRASQLKSATVLKKPEIIDFLSIAHKEYNSLTEKERYDKADISEYGIVVKDMPNPYGKAYRLIEGKHRLYKLKDAGFNGAKFYVLSYDEVKPWIYSRSKDVYIFRSKFKGQNYLVALFILFFLGLVLWQYRKSKLLPKHELHHLVQNQNYTRKVNDYSSN